MIVVMKHALGESPEELEVLRGGLCEWLVELGVVSRSYLESVLERGGPWGAAYDVVLAHLSEHGASGVGCPDRPCLKEAVSLALMEVCEFNRDITSQFADALKEVEGLASGLREVRLNPLQSITEDMIKDHRKWEALAVRVRPLEHTPWPACQAIIDQARVLAGLLETARKELRGSMETPAARTTPLPGKRKRGLLVPAVVSHLRRADASWKQIAALIGQDSDSLRKRCEIAGECRTFRGHTLE